MGGHTSPWLTIIGLTEAGPDGLTPASRDALAQAEIVMGPPRHLALLPDLAAERVAWPVPFADGLDILRGFAGRRVVVLASGDPFWFGAGSVIARNFPDEDWRALPAPSVFSLAAAHLGWPLESTLCLGLHAAPLVRLRPHLTSGARLIVTLRDGASVGDLADYLRQAGCADAKLYVLEALGGPRQKVTTLTANAQIAGSFEAPVAAALELSDAAAALPRASGLPDDAFDTDGVMTKRPVRALTLSALAPRAGEHLLDIGGGSGSVAIEWLLAHPACTATSIETRADRVALIRANAESFGVEDRLEIIEGTVPDALRDNTAPDAVFVGGGLSPDLIAALEARLPAGTRLVANAVTLEGEALLTELHASKGGDLLRIDIARSAPLGRKRGWQASYPVVQWSGTL